jgi:hypothetical protein
VWDIADVVNYSCAVDFLSALEKAKCRDMTGQLTIALCNYLLRKLGVENYWMADGIDPILLAGRLDRIYKKANKMGNPFEAASFLLLEIPKVKFITSDMEAIVYLLVNFYVNAFGKKVIVFDDNLVIDSQSGVDDVIKFSFEELISRVSAEI